jgi:hypothetical protein
MKQARDQLRVLVLLRESSLVMTTCEDVNGVHIEH